MLDVHKNMVVGVAPVLQVLKQIEPETYKQISKDIKGKVEPLRLKVAEGFPNNPWASSKQINWVKYGRTTRGRKPKNAVGSSFPRYEGKKARKGVSVVVGGRKVRTTNSYPIIRIKQSDAGASIYDLAKDNRTAGKESFVKNLNSSGTPSRVMWKRVRANFPLVENSIKTIVIDLQKRFTVQIANETERRSQASSRAGSQVRNALGRFGL
jgi:hypothetical protein